MTSDLDTRARSAAAGLKRAVAETDLKLIASIVETPISWWRRPWISFAGGVAVAAAMLVVMVLAPGDDAIEDVVTAPSTTVLSETSVTTVASSVPGDGDGSLDVSPAPSVDSETTSGTTTEVDTVPPALEIVEPIDGSEREDARIEFRGTTEPGARVFAGQYEAIVESDGSWHIVLLLSPGANRARFTAEDVAGNESEAWVTVTLLAPAVETTTTTKLEEESPTTTEPKEESWPEFKVEATYGESDFEPPFDVYYGVGEPGTVVEVSSAYGSASTTIGSNGAFEVRVDFPEAPVGERFGVIVETSKGNRVELTFKRVG